KRTVLLEDLNAVAAAITYINHSVSKEFHARHISKRFHEQNHQIERCRSNTGSFFTRSKPVPLVGSCRRVKHNNPTIASIRDVQFVCCIVNGKCSRPAQCRFTVDTFTLSRHSNLKSKTSTRGEFENMGIAKSDHRATIATCCNSSCDSRRVSR